MTFAQVDVAFSALRKKECESLSLVSHLFHLSICWDGPSSMLWTRAC